MEQIPRSAFTNVLFSAHSLNNVGLINIFISHPHSEKKAFFSAKDQEMAIQSTQAECCPLSANTKYSPRLAKTSLHGE
jgi:hypothetical protein